MTLYIIVATLSILLEQHSFLWNLTRKGCWLMNDQISGGPLPVNMKPKNAKAILETFGFVFNDRDKNFWYGRFPPGWSRVHTKTRNADMDLLDGLGRRRAFIVVGPNPRLELCRRFNIGRNRDPELHFDDEGYVVFDCQQIVFTTEIISRPETGKDEVYYRAANKLLQDAIDWLNERYPEWKRCDVYWDEE